MSHSEELQAGLSVQRVLDVLSPIAQANAPVVLVSGHSFNQQEVL